MSENVGFEEWEGEIVRFRIEGGEG